MATGREQKGAYSRNSGIVKETISIANSFQHCVLSSTVEGFAISILYRLGPVFGSGLKHSPNIARLSTSVVFWRAIHLDTNQNFAFRATRLAPKLGYFLAGTPMYCLDGLVDRLQSICRIVCMETMISIIHKCCKNMPLEEDNQRVGSAIYFPELRSVRYVSVDQGLARGSIEAPRLCCERTSRSGEKAVSGNKERSQISLK
jgi:hypothetical protein